MPPHLFENIPAVAHEGDVGLGATSLPVVHSGDVVHSGKILAIYDDAIARVSAALA